MKVLRTYKIDDQLENEVTATIRKLNEKHDINLNKNKLIILSFKDFIKKWEKKINA